MRPIDEDVLRALASRGDRNERPRDVRFYLYVREGDPRPAAVALDPVRREAAAHGFAMADAAQPGLVLTIETPVTREVIAALINRVMAMAEHAGLEFDGWESQLVRASLLERLLNR